MFIASECVTRPETWSPVSLVEMCSLCVRNTSGNAAYLFNVHERIFCEFGSMTIDIE
jgi:hypothetical protein